MALVCLNVEAAVLSKLAGPGPYHARSASDRTDDWPFWYVCGPDGRQNVLSFASPYFGAVLTSREAAEAIAVKFNAGEAT